MNQRHRHTKMHPAAPAATISLDKFPTMTAGRLGMQDRHVKCFLAASKNASIYAWVRMGGIVSRGPRLMPSHHTNTTHHVRHSTQPYCNPSLPLPTSPFPITRGIEAAWEATKVPQIRNRTCGAKTQPCIRVHMAQHDPGDNIEQALEALTRVPGMNTTRICTMHPFGGHALFHHNSANRVPLCGSYLLYC